MTDFQNIQELVAKIKESHQKRNEVITKLYYNHKLRTSIERFILNRGGTKEDVVDIYDNTLVQFIKTVMSKTDFQIKTPLEAYLVGIAKNLWFKKLKTRIKNQTEDLETVKYKESVDIDPETLYLDGERKEVIEKILDKMSKNCKEVLMYWSMSFSMKEIAQKLNYKSEAMARKKKCHCLKELLLYLEDHPELINELKER